MGRGYWQFAGICVCVCVCVCMCVCVEGGSRLGGGGGESRLEPSFELIIVFNLVLTARLYLCCASIQCH